MQRKVFVLQVFTICTPSGWMAGAWSEAGLKALHLIKICLYSFKSNKHLSRKSLSAKIINEEFFK